jgi:D-alanine-D-alanine ligase
MIDALHFFNTITNLPLKVWVLAPYLVTNDENIDYYYDFSQSIAEYTATFNSLQIQWQWQPVTMESYTNIIANIAAEKNEGLVYPIVLNICDGDEINGTPGVSVIHLLEKYNIVYTGADAYFYDVTTSKIPMKKAFDAHGVATANWQAITQVNQPTSTLFDTLGHPIIVKPSVSGGSMGIGIKNVVHTQPQLLQQIQKMFDGYRSWNLVTDGLVAESFITGPEFTVFITGSYNRPNDAVIYTPVQRNFHASLPEQQQFLSFDRLWEIYEDETPMPNDANFYEYGLPQKNVIEPLQQLSWQAFVATKGKGYTRVDIRQDKDTKKLYVLELNAQCGLSEDEDYTSIGAILKFSNKTFTNLVIEILKDAVLNYQQKNSETIPTA